MKTQNLFFGMKIRFLIVPLFFIFLLTTCEQENNYYINTKPLQVDYPLGFLPTPSEVYSNVPSALAPAPSGSLPSSYFLEIPSTPFNQGQQQGSCASCASSAGKSILDHVKYDIPYPNDGIIYSPSFLFNQCHVNPNNCLEGSYVTSNLEILKNQGICKLSEMNYNQSNCSAQPTNTQKNLASLHKIDHYYKIDPISNLWIKEFIHAGLPVIIAFQVDDYFMSANVNSIWKKFSSSSKGFHCTLLYGWDDSKNAFKMLNSWGNSWGNNGTIWVDYDLVQNGSSLLYGKIFTEAYIIQNPALANNKPISQFATNGNTNITAGTSVSFVDQSSNNPTSWSWSFPGGTPSSSNSQNPKITYSNPGIYNVTLAVSNQSGSDSYTAQSFISVNQLINKPIAQFATNGNTNITAGSSVSFVDQSSNNPTSWSWSFPGGTPSSSNSQNPKITYSNPGIYNVSLTVFNQAGSDSKIQSSYITVISNQTEVCGQPITDPRDGNTYATINIGGRCWMAEDFRYASKNSVVSNGQRYYEYSDAINIAPVGWHLPSDEEWQTLEVFLGMSQSNANSFGWRGTDQGVKVQVGGSSGLNLDMNGLAVRDFDNSIKFYDYLNWGNYWTSTKYYNNNPAVNSYMTIGRAVSTLVPSQIYRFSSDVINNFYSVRFVRD